MSDPQIPRVLFVSSESRPFASTGGLADVSEALPNTLNAMGVQVERIMPLYRRVWEGQSQHGYSLERTPHTLKIPPLMIPMGGEVIEAEMYSCRHMGTLTYFVGCEEYFDRLELYALPHREYRDNFKRFLFFQKAVVALIDGLGQPYDVLHLNDWQTGLIPLLLDKGLNGTGRARREKVLFTIHNLAYQGVYPAKNLYETNLPGNMLNRYPEIEFYGQINLMKAGLTGADRVNTVSPTYANEVTTEAFGCGLDGVIRALPEPVVGIVNGVDVEAWNPETDKTLPVNYSKSKLANKEVCKQALVEEFGLNYQKDLPVFVLVGRLVDQKGLDVLAKAIEEMLALPLQFLLLGSGQEKYHKLILDWNQAWPEKFAGKIGYDSDLSHRMEAGGDFFLMPSAFEPCGLNQLYSLRYGTLPVVNKTGGLVDTVTDVREHPESGTGFLMNAYTPEALLACIRAALSLYHEKKELKRIQVNGMKQDVTWTRTAERYLALYQELTDSQE